MAELADARASGARGHCPCGFESRRPDHQLGFDYQSDRHCAKTRPQTSNAKFRLITSQIDTAPKLSVVSPPTRRGRALLDVAPFIDCARRCAPYLYHEKTGSKRLIVAHRGSKRLIVAQTSSNRLKAAHCGSSRPKAAPSWLTKAAGPAWAYASAIFSMSARMSSLR